MRAIGGRYARIVCRSLKTHLRKCKAAGNEGSVETREFDRV